MDEQIVLEQRHLRRSGDEFRRVRAVHLAVQREQHRRVVLEVLPLDVLLGLLHALTARSGLEDINGDAELTELGRARYFREARLDRLRVGLQPALQPIDRLDRCLVVGISLVAIDGEEGQRRLEQVFVEAEVEIARDDRLGGRR